MTNWCWYDDDGDNAIVMIIHNDDDVKVMIKQNVDCAVLVIIQLWLQNNMMII